MEVEKRKRKDDGESNGKRGKSGKEDDGVKEDQADPRDEEVDEFFAILKRMQVAVKYFRNRNGGVEAAATAWSPSFKREDFEEDGDSSDKNKNYQNPGLDLNCDPVSFGSDGTA